MGHRWPPLTAVAGAVTDTAMSAVVISVVTVLCLLVCPIPLWRQLVPAVLMVVGIPSRTGVSNLVARARPPIADWAGVAWRSVRARGWRWVAVGSLLLVGLLGLHLPHYLAEAASPAGYLAYPGLVLVVMAITAVVAAIDIARDRRLGWQLGIGVSVVTWLLYVLQETGGLPGLEENWREPTRLLSMLLAGLIIVIASRRLRPTRT